MLSQQKIDSSRRVLKSLFFIVSMILVLAVPAFAQMSYSATVYTDSSFSEDGTVYAWAYTYAPSGTQIRHTYNAHIRMTWTDGSVTENWATAYGSSPAQASVVRFVTADTPAGNIDFTSDHQAFCPQVYNGTVPFLSRSTGCAATPCASIRPVNDAYAKIEVQFGNFKWSPSCIGACTNKPSFAIPVAQASDLPYLQCTTQLLETAGWRVCTTKTCATQVQPGTCTN